MIKITIFFTKIIFIVLNIQYIYSLTHNQWTLINKIIKNPKTSIKEKQIVNNVIYKSYEPYAVKKACEFKKTHSYKCKNIAFEDLIFSSKIGLYKSIVKYNGYNSFINYTSIYIKFELYKLLTETYSSSILPKSYRKTSKNNFTKRELYNYKNLLHTKLIGENTDWEFDKLAFSNNNNNEEIFQINNVINDNRYNIIWNFVNTELDGFSKMVFKYKYSYNVKKLLSNSQISLYMSCSKEKIRKNLIKTCEKIKTFVSESKSQEYI